MLAHMLPKIRVLLLSFCAGVLPVAAFAQAPAAVIEPKGAARPANADALYQAVRTGLPAGEGVQVKDFTLTREGGVFHFADGSFYFYAPVNGRITGAVFLGAASFTLAPQEAREKHSLALLTKTGTLTQNFTSIVLRFTDDTAEEIRKSSAGIAGAPTAKAVEAATDLRKLLRQQMHQNIELRILSDVLSAQQDQRPGQFFLATFHMTGTFLSRNGFFIVDPEGTPMSAPDQVEFDTSSDEGTQSWAAYRMAGQPSNSGVPVHVTAERLDVHFEKSGELKASAETSMTIKRNGLRVVELDLYPTLRVSGVYDDSGASLDFVQENKDYDPQFAVLLPQGAKSGETVHLLTKYDGKGAVTHDGDGMYTLVPPARESWYPAGNESLGGFADFHMTFHLPKGLDIVATGKELSRDNEPGGTRVVWATDSPIPVAGFNLGMFKSAVQKTPEGFTVSAYANTELPDSAAPLANGDLGSMTTTGALPIELSQGAAAIRIYSSFFGKLPYDHVALTEQSYCGFGQSWPMLVYLPICAFWDTTIQHSLGLLDHDASYWHEVTPHEVSHQWWGQEVGFNSYRDQWMSEGFANFSVGVYLMATNKDLKPYHDFWKEQRTNLMQKNQFGKRAVDVGPLTMGWRVSNEKTGNVYQDLIYSKGAYVMHMLQLMYWTPDQGDGPFKHSMQEFVNEYKGKSATTEDLEASFERTMPKWVDAMRDGKLDWFFNEYVYGTELPHYDLTSELTTLPTGETSVHFKLAQSRVSSDFVMLVPLYLQLADGRTVRVASVPLKGEMVSGHTLNLGKLPVAAKTMLINYNEDVLSD
jgi:hypothetical protein